jgi:uncharacterized DUF497 family protein
LKSDLFEWDDRKAEANLRKHGVSFAEAATVLYDKAGLILEDLAHSGDEPRVILIGSSAVGRVLLVVYTERTAQAGGDRYRVISARKATPRERSTYESQRKSGN